MSSIVRSTPIMIILAILCSNALGQPKPINTDFTCAVSSGVLCVKDALKLIASKATEIANATKEIEKLVSQIKDSQTLNRYVVFELSLKRSNLPTMQYHAEFPQRNNIDKKYLLNMFLEAHHAMGYYQRSIQHLLSAEDAVAQKTTVLFKGILEKLQANLICGYRSIFHAFSQDWQTNNDNQIIRFPRRHLLAPSLIHDIHSLVIARHLYQWMELINNVTSDLESKYF